MACGAPTFPHALHPHLLVVAESGGTLVRAADRQETTPQRTPVRPGPRTRHPQLDHPVEREPETVHLDQDRRRDPRTTRIISTTNSRCGTVAARSRNHDLRNTQNFWV